MRNATDSVSNMSVYMNTSETDLIPPRPIRKHLHLHLTFCHPDTTLLKVDEFLPGRRKSLELF